MQASRPLLVEEDVRAPVCYLLHLSLDSTKTNDRLPFADDPTASTTYKLLDAGAFNITYQDNSGASGDYISDVLTIGGVSINSLEMGLAKSATLITGLLGIGYDKNEASDGLASGSFVYPSIIDTMVSQGLIATKAYSLFLDDLESSTGSIIFGGLDTNKFQGELVSLPVVPEHFQNGTAIYLDLSVNMTSFSVTGEAKNTTSLLDDNTKTSFVEFPALLDSGTSLTYLPTDLAGNLFALIGAYDDTQSSGQVFVDCAVDTKSPDQTFNFGFGGSAGASTATIKVPMSEMIFPLTGLFATPSQYVPSAKSLGYSQVCALGLQSGGSGPFLLGDTFLRSAYVVYDLTNNVIGIAQTNFNSTTASVTDFSATATALPSISGVAVSTAVAKKSAASASSTFSVWSAVSLGVGAAFVTLA